MNHKDLLFKQYLLEIDLYKFHIEMLLKYSTFYFAISGAIFSFFFANPKIHGLAWVMLIPSLMGCGLVSFGFVIAPEIKASKNRIKNLSNELEMESATDVLVQAAPLFGMMLCFFLIANASIYLFFKNITA